MGTINAVRFINLTYNNGGIRLNDETLHFNGESTLIALANGGGKSVLVQMMTAPFVHKRFRNTADRAFEDYFNTAKPTFILVEWLLDGGAGKVMNGFMIRRHEEEADELSEPLDIIAIISEYADGSPYDIHSLPVVEKTKKEMVLKGFAACRQLFDSFKKASGNKFFCYDMNNSAQQRQYFDRLQDYHINFKEWENIIKKINLKEGGLTDLFSDCRNEKGLVEKWLLDAVESKLDTDGNRIKEFAKSLTAHARQCYESEDKIKRSERIGKFRAEVAPGEELPGHKSVKGLAEEYRMACEAKEDQLKRIGAFIGSIQALSAEAAARAEKKAYEIGCKEREKERVSHEKYSFEIHEKTAEKRSALLNREQYALEAEALGRKIEDIDRELSIMECLSLNEKRQREKRSYDEVSAQLKVQQEKDEALRPRREELGRFLLCHYRARAHEYKEKLEDIKNAVEECGRKKKSEKEREKETEKELAKVNEGLGRLIERIQDYDREEEKYLREFGGELMRNILGFYEDEALNDIISGVNREIKGLSKEIHGIKEEEERKEKEERRLISDISDGRIRIEKSLHAIKNTEEAKGRLDSERSEREKILKYLRVPEEELFDRDRIIEAADRLIKESEASELMLHERRSGIQRSIKSLQEGQLYMLPQDIIECFNSLGITILTGMEWLRKNNRELERNRELVRQNPFLPYALIVNKEDMEKLKNTDKSFFTSLPVPVILRQDLLRPGGELSYSQHLIDWDRLYFFLNFEEDLLEEENWQRMIGKREKEAGKLSFQIENKRLEREEFIQKKELVRNQELTREKYERTLSLLESGKTALKEEEGAVSRLEGELTENRQYRGKLVQDRERADERLRFLNGKKKAADELLLSYRNYLNSIRKRDEEKKRIENLNARQEASKRIIEMCEDELHALIREEKDARADLREAEDREAVYMEYGSLEGGISGSGSLEKKGMEGGSPDREGSAGHAAYMDVTEAEAEYEAILNKMSGELKRLTEDLKRQGERLKDALRMLEKRMKKGNIAWDDLEGRVYDEAYEENSSARRREIEDRRAERERLFHEEDKRIVSLEKELSYMLEEMAKATGKREPLPKEEIIVRPFDEVLHGINEELKTLGEEKEELENALMLYRSILTGLSEYAGIAKGENISWDEDFSKMGEKELSDFRGILIRDLNGLNEKIQKCRNRLSDRLNTVMAMEDFEEDYYKKPLEALVRLLDSPADILEQIGITISAYEELMKKIQVDLLLIDKERESIEAQLMEYIGSVHGELDKIDSNSTITVRDRPIKMLDISIPSWQENEEFYRVRLKEFIGKTAETCVGYFKENKNTEEYMGTRINLRSIYDTIVGTGNVQIRLYKIEKQREYPISWAEVAKNSGGEGFLSTFVILSSLLYYIRRDENDLFADRKEGKVLLMDNPFGATYSEHLLRPLMELAKKNQTQLICLSGLGGDSIYGRFGNIYVLNLVESSLKGGMRYIKPDHIRGNEPNTLVSAQIEVLGQEEL